MNERNCLLCQKKIPEWKYRSAIFCSDYCRKLAYDMRSGRIKDENSKWEEILKKNE
mgnify:CR=1 FL=1